MSVEIESIEHELEESIASLRQAGIRITPQRQAILRYLISSHTHPTADEIYQALSPDFPNISVATIYNNLRVFKRYWNCKRINIWRLIKVDSTFNTIIIIILYVNNVVRLLDFQYPQLNEIERLAQHMTDFDVTHHRMEIYGVCKECQDK